ncbi:ATP-binding protein [Chryseobacterium jejuense]|uniref:ATP-binding protein n=1 Tax=Chryseobacterium jejuense TaxID=445960 RepID=UPI001AE953D0|nr:ATP-binding protein [Chryseobacterium jejuense]MBP2615552.1 signal transduction histidine kinase [Chryseobacterium jejuense]
MKFTFNPRILRHLGYELITSDEIAITELIKNSYDARAENVYVQFLSTIENFDENKSKVKIPEFIYDSVKKLNSSGIIVIEDDGKGMTYDVLKKGFFEVGSTLKKNEKNDLEENDNNIILGDKGIGRLAAQRIAPIIIVESAAKGTHTTNIVEVEWDKFINNINFEAPEWTGDLTEDIAYTRLWLIGTDDNSIDFNRFSELKEDFEVDLFGNMGPSLGTRLIIKSELQTALGFLYSPFETNKSLINIDISVNGVPIRLDFNYQALNVAESIHSFKSTLIFDESGKPIDIKFDLRFDIRPWFIERIHHRELGNVLYQDWKRSSLDYYKLYQKYKDEYELNLSESFLLSTELNKWKKKNGNKNIDSQLFIESILKLAPLEGKIYSFKRDISLMNMARRSAIENGYIDPSTKINYDIRPFLASNNGIKLYRNSFRIATIGNKDNDWLELQQKRTSGQQFYRFELGNVVGYIKINDKKQEYIYETSSREHLTDNIYAESLRITLNEILEIFSPNFSKLAVELTKRFLSLEPNWIPENTEEEIQHEVDKAKEIFEAAKRNMAAIQVAITAIKDNIDLDSEEKIASVKKVFKTLEPVALNFEQNIEDTTRSLKSANMLLEVAKQEQVRIKTEAYNSYKLMANGLVTEIITHELHSLLNNSEEEGKRYDEHFQIIEKYFLENELYDINRIHVQPVKKKFEHLFNKMGDLAQFYSFLDKTFIKSEGNRALLPTDVKSELEIIIERFKFRLERHRINIDVSSVDIVWEVPKGALLHVFYNLIDNSIYWIKQRQKLSKSNKKYERSQSDSIVIRSTSSNTLQFYDTGTGVLDKYQHILFNELVSGKQDGRGMGLYIVRQFLKSFGGNIELLPLKNEYDHRYIFEINLK